MPTQDEYYRIIVRSESEFISFRYQDVGNKNGQLQRLAGMRYTGRWDTQAWLISKKSAHKRGKNLIADTKDVRIFLGQLGARPNHLRGDLFTLREEEIDETDDRKKYLQLRILEKQRYKPPDR